MEKKNYACELLCHLSDVVFDLNFNIYIYIVIHYFFFWYKNVNFTLKDPCFDYVRWIKVPFFLTCNRICGKVMVMFCAFKANLSTFKVQCLLHSLTN